MRLHARAARHPRWGYRMLHWALGQEAYRRDVTLHFIDPGQPVQNGCFLRPVSAMAAEINEEWEAGRIYRNPESE